MNYSQYDEIASTYDSLFIDEASLKENEEVRAMLSPLTGLTYDIGCGTGLLVEIMGLQPMSYFGVDPSRGMLDRFIQKHPTFKESVACIPFDAEDKRLRTFDNVVSLFGSISYVDEISLRKLAIFHKGKKFLMFYKEDYVPVTYTKTNVSFEHNRYRKNVLKQIFFNCKVDEYHNYLIVHN